MSKWDGVVFPAYGISTRSARVALFTERGVGRFISERNDCRHLLTMGSRDEFAMGNFIPLTSGDRLLEAKVPRLIRDKAKKLTFIGDLEMEVG